MSGYSTIILPLFFALGTFQKKKKIRKTNRGETTQDKKRSELRRTNKQTAKIYTYKQYKFIESQGNQQKKRKRNSEYPLGTPRFPQRTRQISKQTKRHGINVSFPPTEPIIPSHPQKSPKRKPKSLHRSWFLYPKAEGESV